MFSLSMFSAETFQRAVHFCTGRRPLETLDQLLDRAGRYFPKTALLQPASECFQTLGELLYRAVVKEQGFMLL